jgi:hypothetical protein
MESGKESLDALYKEWDIKKNDLKKILEDLYENKKKHEAITIR